MKTYMAKGETVQRDWLLVDAKDQVLGRMASQVASMLRGKHKSVFTPHVDCGDHVIVINAADIVLTGNKLDQKIYYSHSGYVGGLKETKYRDLIARKPEFVVYEAVRRMLPKGPLGRKMLKKLRVYAGSEHAHEAQQPKAIELKY